MRVGRGVNVVGGMGVRGVGRDVWMLGGKLGLGYDFSRTWTVWERIEVPMGRVAL